MADTGDPFDDEPTDPTGDGIPFDEELEVTEIPELGDTPAPTLDEAARCPECETGVDGRGLKRIADFVPPPRSREEALRLGDCVATQSMRWRWCAVAFWFKGRVRVYWGPGDPPDPGRRR